MSKYDQMSGALSILGGLTMDITRDFLNSVFSSATDVAQETVECLGEEASLQFARIASDCLLVTEKIHDDYEPDELKNLLTFQLWGLPKELRWLQFLFLAGNYPLVTARLRYLWESVYRAYFADAHKDDAVRRLGPDEKLDWIENHEPRLDWKNCVEVVLRDVLPLAEAESEVLEHYKELWHHLNRHVHPSQDVQIRQLGDTALLVADRFDQPWAEHTLRIGLEVFDVIWLAVLRYYERAALSVAEAQLDVAYPITQLVLRRCTNAE